MNQILNTDLKNSIHNSDSFIQGKDLTVEKNRTEKKSFRVQFILSIISIFIFVSLYFYSKFLLNQKENLSDTLKDNYSISQLYAKNSDTNSLSYNHSMIIGMIEIPKLSLSYPIFSSLDDELLKVAPCKFSGEMPPNSSNLCIAGHNYDNTKFFSNIGSLENGDEIFIFNQVGIKFIYSVFNKYEVEDNDFSPIEKDYQGGNELTLITCNNLNKRRIVVKAKIENT